MRTAPTTRKCTATRHVWRPTERGRIRATLLMIERRWDDLSPAQRNHVIELLASLSAALRQEQVAQLQKGQVPA